MVERINITPMNSLLFLSDSDLGKAPTPVWGAQILATPSCISFICNPEPDGPTEVILGWKHEVDPGGLPTFEGNLETPQRAAVVSTVDCKAVMKMKVPDTRTHVCIWLSHPRWPEKVTIGLE